MYLIVQTVEGLMKTTMENIKSMIDVNTVVGDAVEASDGTVIVPVSKVSFAFVAGGGTLSVSNNKSDDEVEDNPFAGGTGAGVTVQPIGFLATTNGHLKMLPVNYNTTVDRIIDLVPNVIENIEGFVAKRDNSKKSETSEDYEKID